MLADTEFITKLQNRVTTLWIRIYKSYFYIPIFQTKILRSHYLRRMKEDVLKDLPPKITQDYYCQLSPIQQLLYEDFAKEQKDKNKNDKSHIFAALQYLRKVCNHPKLVLQNSDHKHYNLVQKLLAESNSNLNALR